jgi:hypothetical protein
MNSVNRFFIGLTLVLSNSSVSVAKTSLQLDLNVSMTTHIHQFIDHRENTYRGGAYCNPGGKADENNDLGAQVVTAIEGNGQLELNETVQERNYIVQRGQHVSRVLVVKSSSFKVDQIETMNVDILDKKTLTQNWEEDHTCSTDKYAASASNDNMTGTLSAKYKMPESAWLVEVRILKKSGVFAKINGVEPPLPFLDSLSPQRASNTVGAVQYIWAKPGSIISHDFKFDKLSIGKDLQSGYQITFSPVVSRLPAVPLVKLLKSLEDKIASIKLPKIKTDQ